MVGHERVWTFLLRTPELLEAGLRCALAEGLPPQLRPTKLARAIAGAPISLNPDLVFGESAIADVKYKHSRSSWGERGALYQLVAFATGFKVHHAALIDFQTGPHATRPTLSFGSVQVTHLPWRVADGLGPQEALEDLTARLIEWAEEWAVIAAG